MSLRSSPSVVAPPEKEGLEWLVRSVAGDKLHLQTIGRHASA